MLRIGLLGILGIFDLSKYLKIKKRPTLEIYPLKPSLIILEDWNYENAVNFFAALTGYSIFFFEKLVPPPKSVCGSPYGRGTIPYFLKKWFLLGLLWNLTWPH